MNRLIQRMFENRGYTHALLREISDPSYGKLRGIDEMAARLRELHESGSTITIYPDFDMDGIAAGTAGFAGFAELGFTVNLFVPDPEKGYGIRGDDIRELMFRFPATKAIVTCDTGIGCTEAASVCRELGVELLVTDHHKQQDPIDADIVVDPLAFGETYPHPTICGAFVLWQVMQRYADLYCNYFTQDQIRRLRVFAGIGTVSDGMPVLYENRQCVKDAVSVCQLVYGDGTPSSVASIKGCNTYRLAFWGLYNIMKVFEEHGTIKDASSVDEDFFGFYMAPMFNSVKRMGGNMENAFGVFFANESPQCSNMLYDLNVQRRAQVLKDLEACKARPQPFAPYIWYSDAREGILGLIATKLLEETGTPVFVMNDRGSGSGKGVRYHGSARCPDWYCGLERVSSLVFAAGHDCSFGWGADTPVELDNFYRFLCDDVPKVQSSIQIEEVRPDFVISTDWSRDAGIDIELFNGFLDEISDYRPFGKGFPAPSSLLRFRNSDIVEKRQMGSAKQHLKISLANGFDVLCWGQGHLMNALSASPATSWHHVYGNLGRSEYRGETYVSYTGVLEPDAEKGDS